MNRSQNNPPKSIQTGLALLTASNPIYLHQAVRDVDYYAATLGLEVKRCRSI